MSKTIWKYHVPIEDSFVTIFMPKGAKVLSVQVQDGIPVLWAEVDPDAEREIRKFITHGTGHTIEHNGIYIGTYQLYAGRIIAHLYEVTQ